MKLSDSWFTALSTGERGGMVFVTGRLELEEFRASEKLRIRVEIRWPYAPDAQGMPDEDTAQLIGEIEPLLRRTMERDKLAILTGNYTGDGEKYWIFYTRHLPSFGERLNACLEPYPLLPLDIECEEDVLWEEYTDMLGLYSPEAEN